MTHSALRKSTSVVSVTSFPLTSVCYYLHIYLHITHNRLILYIILQYVNVDVPDFSMNLSYGLFLTSKTEHINHVSSQAYGRMH